MTPVSKSAESVENFRTAVLGYDSARAGIEDLLRNQPGAVLLPAYIGWSPREGSGVLDPVLQSGVEYGFYSVAGDLRIDLGLLEVALAARSWRYLFIIHYFGRTAGDPEAIRRLAERYGVVVVEDLAHGFFSAKCGSRSGRAGDVLAYSLHKMFPFKNGGLIEYRDSNFVGGLMPTRPDLLPAVLSYDWRGIADARIEIFTRTIGELDGLPSARGRFEIMWRDLEGGDVPQSLPVRILNGSRDAIYHAMNDAGFGMVSLYHTLTEQVQSGHPVEVALSQSIINFPVHQDVSVDQIGPMVKEFGRSLNR